MSSAYTAFQSLFWWNDLMSTTNLHKLTLLLLCFNPCSGGMTL